MTPRRRARQQELFSPQDANPRAPRSRGTLPASRELDQYPINSALRSRRAQARLRRSNSPIRPRPVSRETVFTTEPESPQFPRGQNGTRRRRGQEAYTRRLSPGLVSLGLAWISLDFLVCSFGFLWISFGFPWPSLAWYRDLSKGYGPPPPPPGEFGVFSASPKNRPSGESDHELGEGAHGSEGLRHGDGDLAFYACNASR